MLHTFFPILQINTDKILTGQKSDTQVNWLNLVNPFYFQ